jgi:chemotaxis protein MotB
MRRKRHSEEHENHERWLVSYADFITLLFAFFVVMYAISSVNEGKYRILSDSLTSAFRNVTPSAINPIQVGQPTAGQIVRPVASAVEVKPADTPEARKMQNMASELKGSLGTMIDQGKVRVTQSRRGIAIEINDSILFDPARADLQLASSEMLLAVAEMVRGTDNLIQIEGHTDNQPIRSAQFPSNWELASARAASVVRLFVEAGIAPQRMVVIGYGEFRPVEPNDTIERRARNRRVTLNILADNRDDVSVLPLSPDQP